MNACLASAGCPLRLFQPVPWVTQDALGNPNAFRSSKSNAKVGIEPEKAGHREFPGGPPSKYYPGPTMLNFRDLTRSGAFIVVWTCHERVRFLGVFKPSQLASARPSKVRPMSSGFVPRMACFGSGTAYYRNCPTPGRALLDSRGRPRTSGRCPKARGCLKGFQGS